MDRLTRTSNSHGNTNSNDNNNNNNRPKNDEELFTEDMRQRKQEFNQRYEHFRGRGRWGGYTLQGIPQVNAKQEAESDTHAHAHATAAPSLSVVAPTSTATSASASTTRNKNTITRTRARKVARKQPMIQIKDIQHYKEEVVDAKDASLVVVRFYACKWFTYSTVLVCNSIGFVRLIVVLRWLSFGLFCLTHSLPLVFPCALL